MTARKAFLIDPDKREKGAEDVRTFLLSMKPGKKVVVQLFFYQNPRSNEQNRYLNGVAVPLLCDATGYDPDDIREYLNGTYFGWKEKRVPGKRIVQVPIRTTTTDEDGEYNPLSTQAFAEYIAFVQRFGAEHGINIPDPDPTR